MIVEIGPGLFRGLTLAERIAQGRRPASTPPLDEEGSHRERIHREKWRKDAGLKSDDLFAAYLNHHGITVEEFDAVLSETPEQLQARIGAPSPWMIDSATAWQRDLRGELPRLGDSLEEDLAGRFAAVARPLIRWAGQQLDGIREALGSTVEARVDWKAVRGSLLRRLIRRLDRSTGLSLTLELHIDALEADVENVTRVHLQRFREKIADAETGWLLLQRYPVLLRHLRDQTTAWIEASAELLRRFLADLPDLEARGLCPRGDRLSAVEMDLGDLHRGGRSVCQLRFDRGARAIYKPRSLHLDLGYQRLLEWFNERGFSVPLRTVQIIDKGDYGWMEHVAHLPCQSQGEVQHFFTRQGAQVALLLALAAADMHNGNIIAQGEHPVIVDLETLLYPLMQSASEIGPEDRHWPDSVLGSLMLPQRFWDDDDTEGREVGGLANPVGKAGGGIAVLTFREDDDGVGFTQQAWQGQSERNLPVYGDQVIEASGHCDAIVAGFAEAYDLLCQHRDALLAPGGPLAHFAGGEVRVVTLPTALYELPLKDSVHPHRVQDALDRERLFTRILRIGSRSQPLMLFLFAGARAAFERGDLPWFGARCDGLALSDGQGLVHEGALAESGLGRARRLIEGFGPAHRARQIELVRASIMLRPVHAEPLVQRPIGERRRLGKAASLDLVRVAEHLAGDLTAKAIRSEGEILWMGPGVTAQLRWRVGPVQLDLHSGLPGIMLALAYLAQVTGNGAHEETARDILQTIRRRLQRLPLKALGMLNGQGGLTHALAQVGRLWNEPAALDLAAEQAGRLPSLIAAGKNHRGDVAQGAAGALLGLQTLLAARHDDPVVASARACADSVLASGFERNGGGFFFGAGGAAYALALAGKTCGDPRYLDAGARVVSDENRGTSPLPPASWDLALASLASRSLDWPSTPEREPELRRRLEQLTCPADDSLWQGSLGAAELLLLAEQLGVGPLRGPSALELAAVALGDIERHGPRTAVPHGLGAPGLFCGRAGVIYQLIRLAHPDRVPSLLLPNSTAVNATSRKERHAC